jgi:hypothetical protein
MRGTNPKYVAARAAILATRAQPAQPFHMRADSPRDSKTKSQRRLSTALRANLKRRKAQARGRAAGTASPRGAKAHDSAGINENE